MTSKMAWPKIYAKKITSLKFDFQKSLMCVYYICNSCFFEVEIVVIPLSLFFFFNLILFYF